MEPHVTANFPQSLLYSMRVNHIGFGASYSTLCHIAVLSIINSAALMKSILSLAK